MKYEVIMPTISHLKALDSRLNHSSAAPQSLSAATIAYTKYSRLPVNQQTLLIAPMEYTDSVAKLLITGLE